MGENIKLFVYGVSSSCPKGILEKEFNRYGRVSDVFITGKGYAFITMESKDEAEDAIDALNGKKVDGQDIKVEMAVIIKLCCVYFIVRHEKENQSPVLYHSISSQIIFSMEKALPEAVTVVVGEILEIVTDVGTVEVDALETETGNATEDIEVVEDVSMEAIAGNRTLVFQSI